MTQDGTIRTDKDDRDMTAGLEGWKKLNYPAEIISEKMRKLIGL